MNISAINSNVNFKNLYDGYTLENRLEKKTSKKFLNELNGTRQAIKENGLDRLQNVDIILNVDDNDKFYGVISSKAEGVPHHPQATCEISTKEKDVNKFTKWAENWNDLYSKEMLELLNKIIYGSRTPMTDEMSDKLLALQKRD